ncbi:ribosomal protein L7/L12 [Aeromicrobium endophyticum]|nr:ribosomal protein L7/L12 [Aeromicrobium endophyticum]
MDWTGVAIVVLAVCLVASLAASWKGRSRTPSVPVPLVPLDEATAREVSDLIARDRKIQAIKLVRDATGAGLREAKERVEAWDAAPSAQPVETSAVLDDLAAEARSVRDASGPIHAIKLVRERTGWGLADAKGYVDRLG